MSTDLRRKTTVSDHWPIKQITLSVRVCVYRTDSSGNDRNRSCNAEHSTKGRGEESSTSPLMCYVTSEERLMYSRCTIMWVQGTV